MNTCPATRRPPRVIGNAFGHALDVDLMDLAWRVRTDDTLRAYEHVLTCAACACRYARCVADQQLAEGGGLV